MNQLEVMQRRDAEYRELQRENAALKKQIANAHYRDLQMAREDADVFAMVSRHHTPRPSKQSEQHKHPFDFDRAEIEVVDAKYYKILDEKGINRRPKMRYYFRFAFFLVAELAVMVANHFDWISTTYAVAIGLFIFLLYSYFRLFA